MSDINLADDKIFAVKQTIIYFVVCAPRAWSAEKVQEMTNRELGRPGTSGNEWVICDNLPENWGTENPLNCSEDHRAHWLLNC